MNDESNQKNVIETQTPKQSFWRKHWWWAIPINIMNAVLWFGVETLFMFQNIPLLIALIILIGSFILTDKLLAWKFGRPKPRTWKALQMLFVAGSIYLIYIVLILFVMRYYVPVTSISEKTTHVTKPLTSDGLEIDVIGAIEERFVPKKKPEENGFRYVIEQFGIEHLLDNEGDLESQKNISDALIKQLEINNVEPSVTYQSFTNYFIKYFEDIDKDHSDEKKDYSDKENTPELEIDQKTLNPSERVRNMKNLLYEKIWNTNTMIGDAPVTEVIHWLETNGKALDEFGKAVRFPVYYAPMLTLSDKTPISFFSCYEYSFHRDIVQELRIRIMYSLGVGDFDKAKYDVMTIIKLADMQMRYLSTDLRFTFAGAIFGTGNYAVLDLIRFGNMTKRQLEQLQHELQQFRTMPDFDDLIFVARMQSIDLLYNIANLRMNFDTIVSNKENNEKISKSLNYKITEYSILTFRYFGWTPVFAKQQADFDYFEELLGNGFSKTQLTTFEEQYETKNRQFPPGTVYELLILFLRKGMYQAIPAIIGEVVGQLISDPRRLISGRYNIETSKRLLDIAFALEFYRHDHGNYPVSLMELAGKYIEIIPVDPYTDNEPFRYRLDLQPEVNPDNTANNKKSLQKQNADYLLYSVGTNGKDDHGVGRGYGYCNKTQNTTENHHVTDQKTPDVPPKSGDDIHIYMLRDTNIL
ncbi:MAG: hypothetical protein LBC20_06065 [Planctomycetaceae bacterium]|jgi:hypothetical protein|nr:hypothetical protein [Planctomycetaceae bacterium]